MFYKTANNSCVNVDKINLLIIHKQPKKNSNPQPVYYEYCVRALTDDYQERIFLSKFFDTESEAIEKMKSVAADINMRKQARVTVCGSDLKNK